MLLKRNNMVLRLEISLIASVTSELRSPSPTKLYIAAKLDTTSSVKVEDLSPFPFEGR